MGREEVEKIGVNGSSRRVLMLQGEHSAIRKDLLSCTAECWNGYQDGDTATVCVNLRESA